MARKKKTKKKAARRRVGGGLKSMLNPNSDLVKIGSIAIGLLAEKPVNNAIDKMIPPDKLDQKIVAGGQVGLGGAYLMFAKKKNIIFTVGSGVLAGAGLRRGLRAFGIGGYQNVRYVNGYQNVREVMAGNNQSLLQAGGGTMSDMRTYKRATVGAFDGTGSGIRNSDR